MVTYSLQCNQIAHGAFSGERECHFDAYVGGRIQRVSPSVPQGYVSPKSRTVRVSSAVVKGDKTEIRLAIGGSGEFEHFTVPSRLVTLVSQK